MNQAAPPLSFLSLPPSFSFKTFSVSLPYNIPQSTYVQQIRVERAHIFRTKRREKRIRLSFTAFSWEFHGRWLLSPLSSLRWGGGVEGDFQGRSPFFGRDECGRKGEKVLYAQDQGSVCYYCGAPLRRQHHRAMESKERPSSSSSSSTPILFPKGVLHTKKEIYAGKGFMKSQTQTLL